MAMDLVTDGSVLGAERAMPSTAPPEPHRSDGESTVRRGGAPDSPLARGLGWFSLGLGLAEVAATRALAGVIGIPADDAGRRLLRAFGVREMASGVGILSRRTPTPWLWSRVAGDALDLAVLGMALASPRSNRRRLGLATAAVAGVTLLDVVESLRQTESTRGVVDRFARPTTIHVTRSVTVNRSPADVYAFCRQLENLPSFMAHLESVQSLGDRRSHWKAKAPAGTTVEWDAEIVDERPQQLIAWRSLDGSQIPNGGSVRFNPGPGGHGTEVHVYVEYRPPGGTLGAAVARLFGEEPSKQVQDDLRRLKQLLETGEIARAQRSGFAGQPGHGTADVG